MKKENAINYIKENIEQIENAKSDYAFSNNAIREILTNIYIKVSMIGERPKEKWIPVSERLPEEREWVGTKRFGTTISDEVYVTFETPDGERFTKHLSFQNGGLSQTDQEHMRVWFKGAVPIAWMPLPEPYKAEMEVDNDK